jgi:hypothetical protein
MSAPADRYPGTQPFGDNALDRLRFFGRDTESELLLHQLIGADLLVLFGKPGLGKTSLLNARLFPLLRERDFLPLPVRFDQSNSFAPVQVFTTAIERVCELEKIDYTPGKGDGLWEFFKTAVFWRGDRLQTPVLVLDQFEEIFTLQTEKFRRVVAGELGELVSRRLPDRLRQRLQSDQPLDFSEKAPELKVLLSLREDDLGMLQELTPQLPSILQNRFRLTPLSDIDGRRAVTEPAALVSGKIEFATAPFTYEPGTVEAIVTAAQTPRGGIDPFVLQLVCGHVEREVRRRQADGPTGPAITVNSSYLGGKAGTRPLTASFYFYLDSIKRLPQARARNRARALCEEGLLTGNGRRRSLLEEDLLKYFKLDPESLQLLVRVRLLRCEVRDGSYYYEISHDRIAEAIHHHRRWRMSRKLKLGLAMVGSLAIVALVCQYVEVQQAKRAQHQAERLLDDLIKGDRFLNRGDLDAALRSFQKYLAIAQKLAARDPANDEWQRDLSISYDKIGDVQAAQGDLKAASSTSSAAAYCSLGKRFSSSGRTSSA